MPYAGTDLSDIDTAKPPNSGADGTVADMDDALRETKLCLKNSWSAGALAEHGGNGEHNIPYNVTASRPAAGYEGRLFLNSDAITNFIRIDRDSGVAWAGQEVVEYSWKQFGCFIGEDSINSNSVFQLTTSAADMLVIREYFSHTGTFYFTGYLDYLCDDGGSYTIRSVLKIDGSTIVTVDKTLPLSESWNSFLSGIDTGDVVRIPAAGPQSFTIASTGWKNIIITAHMTARPSSSANAFLGAGSYRIYRGL